PMKIPSMALPDRRRTRSAESGTPTVSTSSTVVHAALRMFMSRPLLLGNWERRGDLQIDDQQQLLLDLEKPQGGSRRQRFLDAVVALRLERVAPCLEVERPAGQ